MRRDRVIRLNFRHAARGRGLVRDNLGGRRQDILDGRAGMKGHACLQYAVELDVVEEDRTSFVHVGVRPVHEHEMKVRSLGIAGVACKAQQVTLRDGAAFVRRTGKRREVCRDCTVLHVGVAGELAIAMVNRDRVPAARDSIQLDAGLGIGGMTDVEVDDVAGSNCDDLLPPHKAVGVAGFLNRFAISVHLGAKVPVLVDGDNVVAIALVIARAWGSEAQDSTAVPSLGGAKAKLMTSADLVAEGELFRGGFAFT